jgi:hypothetical protein
VLEGHVRLTGLVMAVEHLPAEVTVLLGTAPTMRKNHPTEASTTRSQHDDGFIYCAMASQHAGA